jgi:urocanate hydratase
MYIGPQGIVHGTTITVLNAFRKPKPVRRTFLTSASGMMGAQPKAGNIAGCITVCAENQLYTFVTAKVGSTKLSKILMN